MSTEHSELSVPSVVADQPLAASRKLFHVGFWIRELPFSLVLIITLIGVAYTTVSKQPITGYWEILAPLIALVCVGAGWHHTPDRMARLRLIGTQVLHWLAFLVVMNLMLLTSVQRIFSAGATGLSIFTLLALGTFTAGVHVLSWQVCLLGVVMALGIPAIAWVENSALIVVLIVGVAVGVAAVVWWHIHDWRAHARGAPPPTVPL